MPLASLTLFRQRLVAMGILGFLFLLSLYYFSPVAESNLSALFASITYPLGYALLFGLVIIALALLLLSYRHTPDDSDSDRAHMRDIRAIIVAISVYGMLFWVSSFGIVWYGILIYFLFLVVIFAGMRLIDREIDEIIGDRLNLMSSASVILIGVFVFMAAIPHAWTNIQNSGFVDYKMGSITSEAASFRPGYLETLSRLNIADEKKAVDTIISSARHIQIKEAIARYQPQNLSTLEGVLTELERQLASAASAREYL